MRQKRDYLPKLLEYIELANKIPHEYWNFPDQRYAFMHTVERLKKENKTYTNLEIIETYYEALKDRPKELLDMIFDKPLNELDLYVLQEKIDLFATVKAVLSVIAEAVNYERDGEGTPNELLIEMDEMSHFLRVMVFVNDKGAVEVKTNEFLEFLVNNQIEARRLRLCEICQKHFWAYRLDKWACSKGCGNILRQRLWQSENKEIYNRRRRSNYAYKKMLEKRKEKK